MNDFLGYSEADPEILKFYTDSGETEVTSTLDIDCLALFNLVHIHRKRVLQVIVYAYKQRHRAYHNAHMVHLGYFGTI